MSTKKKWFLIPHKKLETRASYLEKVDALQIISFPEDGWKRKRALNNLTQKGFRALNSFITSSPKRKRRRNNYFRKASISDVLRILNNCFTVNKNVKQKAYTTESSNYCYRCGNEEGLLSCPESDWADCRFNNTIVDRTISTKMYHDKTMLVIQAIALIRSNRLPIKYGKNEGVVYFSYCGKQVSFHDPRNIIRCKLYDGEWSQIKNSKIPFTYIYN